VIILLSSLALTWMSQRLLKTLSIKDAKSLMFASIIYNPLVLILLVIDKI